MREEWGVTERTINQRTANQQVWAMDSDDDEQHTRGFVPVAADSYCAGDNEPVNDRPDTQTQTDIGGTDSKTRISVRKAASLCYHRPTAAADELRAIIATKLLPRRVYDRE